MSRFRNTLTQTTRLGMVAAAASRVTVTLPEPPASSVPEGKPSHWANEQGTLFRNPWESFRKVVRPLNKNP